jgi:integrase
MLTLAQVTALRDKPGRYLHERGLYLVVETPTKRYWQFRYMFQKRARAMSFGPEGPITLAGAEKLHLEARTLLAQGIDPLEARQQARTPPPSRTFAAVASAFMDSHDAGWRSRQHRAQWRQTIAAYANPVLGAKMVDCIGVNDVLAVLQPIWEAKPETASRLRGRIEVILSYAKTRGWRSGENPAAWRDNMALLLPPKGKVRPVVHHAALPWREAPGFWALLAGQDGFGARALGFAILTAARSGEVRGMTWGEIDPAAAVWTVPGGRMKAGRPHRVPLGEAALALLEGQRALCHSALVFPGRTEGSMLSDMSLTAVLRRMGLAHLTAHGFRSTFRDWCSDTGKQADAAEAALAHAPASKVIAAYARSDLLEQRRGLMAAWAEFLTAPAAEVVPLRAA